MPQGLEVYDSNGVLILGPNNPPLRVIGNLHINTGNGVTWPWTHPPGTVWSVPIVGPFNGVQVLPVAGQIRGMNVSIGANAVTFTATQYIAMYTAMIYDQLVI